MYHVEGSGGVLGRSFEPYIVNIYISISSNNVLEMFWKNVILYNNS